MREPLISVIVPIYNVEKYLKRCVQSIVNQTYQNLEILLVDDGSADSSGRICDELALHDSRIRVIHQKNGGQANARNHGLELAQGALIAFVDSDDYITPDLYTELYQLMVQHDAQITCCGIERVDDSGHVSYFNDNIDDLLILNPSQALLELVANYRVTSSPCDKLFQREIFDDNRMTEGMIYEDYDIMHRCIYRAKRVVYTGNPMYCYYQSPNSTIRAAFHPRRFDEMTAEKRRYAFYQEHCPENLEAEASHYLETGITILARSKGAKGCKIKRRELRKDLMLFQSRHQQVCVHPEYQRKLQVLRRGLFFYDLAIDLAAIKRKVLK